MSAPLPTRAPAVAGAPDPSPWRDPVRDRAWWRLTARPQKWALYREEPGFVAAQAALLAHQEAAVVGALHRHAVVLLKPEAWIEGVVSATLDFLARNGFHVVRAFRVALPPLVSREIWRYQWNAATVERIVLSELVLSLGPTYGVVLRDVWMPHVAVPAAVRLARLKGPSQPERQRPGQLRHELRAPNRIVSYVHIPDEPADVVRDLSIVLDRGDAVGTLRRAFAAPMEPVPVDLRDGLPGVSRLARPTNAAGVTAAAGVEEPVGHRGLPLAARIDRLAAVVGGCRQADGTYHLPPAVWSALLDLCADVAAQPDPGTKLIDGIPAGAWSAT